MTIAELITVILAASSVVTALFVLYGKFIRPVRKVAEQVEANKKEIERLEEKFERIQNMRDDDRGFSAEIRGVIMESLLAILDGLERAGINGKNSTAKQRIIEFLSKQTGGK